MQLVKFRTLGLLGSTLFFGCVNFATASYPTINGPQFDSDGSFQLTPSLPDSPYFLNDIWMKKGNGNWQPLQVGYRDYAVNVDVSTVGDYEFKTRWRNPNTQPNTYSEFGNSMVVIVSGIAPPDRPTISVPASDTDGNYVVSWGHVPRADRYNLERIVNGGAWTFLQSNSTTSYTASIQAAGSYSYRVKACNVTGCVVSNISSITVTNANALIPNAPSPITRTPNTITWLPVANASYYEADFYYDRSGWQRASYMFDFGAWFGTSGYIPQRFRVRACNMNAICSAFTYSY